MNDEQKKVILTKVKQRTANLTIELSDDLLNSAIDDATAAARLDILPKNCWSLAITYLACTIVYAIATGSNGNVASATILGAQQSMFAPTLANNPYWQLYVNLTKPYLADLQKGAVWSDN